VPKAMFLITMLLASLSHLSAQEPREQSYVEIARLSELAPGIPIVLPKNAFFDETGNLVMVDEAESRIVVFDSAMATVLTAGRRGDGPGEYQRPGPVGPVVSSQGGIAVWDRIQGRLTELDSDLAVRWSLKLPVSFREHGFIESLYSMDDSTFIAAATTWPMSGYNEESFTHVFLATRDSVNSSVAVYPGYDLLTDFSDPRFTTVLRMPFGAVTVIRFEADGQHYWTGRTDSSVFSRVRVSDGLQVAVFELPLTGEPVTSQDRKEYLRAQEHEFERSGELSRVPRETWEERWREMRSSLEFPDTKPLWEDFSIDNRGDLWIRTASSASFARIWLNVSPRGRVLRTVAVPHSGPVYMAAVRDDLIVVSEKNELGAWEVVSYGP